MKASIFFLVLTFFAGAAYGQVYKWVDENGRVQFSGTLPPTQSASDVQEVNISEGNFISQDQAQQERNRAYLAERQAERDEAEARRAAVANRPGIPGPLTTAADIAQEQDRLRDARNAMRDSPLRAPHARMAPGAR